MLSLTFNSNDNGSRASPRRRAPVLCLDYELVLTGCLPVQLARHSYNVDVSHGVHSEVTGLVPLTDADHGLASVLQVQVSHGDDGDQLTNLGRLLNPGLLLPLIREVTELNLRVVIILILLANLPRVSMMFQPS